MFDASRYTIGWICAILPELQAARQFLDEEITEDSFVQDANDNNKYIFGRIKKHYVVIAALPLGVYGTTSATSVATNMIRTFGSLRLGLMVGIAGGAPLYEGKEQDIRLGDVVVSIPTDGHGGVYQYDYGKAIQDQDFTITSHMNRPPDFVLAAAQYLRSTIEASGNDIDQRINVKIAANSRLRKSYERPKDDVLYSSTFVHRPGESNSDQAHLISRPSRTDEDQPTIHYGLIASGNTLMKDAHIRDRFARDHGVLCFEMEAAGMMQTSKFIVIRGICDYADSHKNKIWQGYAAMAAAAYARLLLLEINPTKVSTEQSLGETILGELQELREHVTHQTNSTFRRDIIDWLKAPDASMNYQRALEQRSPGSGSWLLSNDILGEKATWLYGFSGCGKTILASTIIEHFQKKQRVIYFFFDFRDPDKQTFEKMLRSLITQCCHLTHDSCLERLFSHCAGSQPTLAQLRKCLLEMLQTPTRLVLDALDESTDRADIMLWARTLVEQCPVQIIVTSRAEHDIKPAMTWATGMEVHHEINRDIQEYVRYRLHNDDGFSKWRKRPDLLEEIQTVLSSKAEGIFRWASCQLDALKSCVNEKSLRDTLESLPADLTETYTRILDRVPTQYKHYTLRALQFVCYSREPLLVEHIVEAIVTSINLEGSRPIRIDERIQHEPDLAMILTSLVVVSRTMSPWNEPIEQVQLAHSSVKDYLTSASAIWAELAEQPARNAIAKTCLVYAITACEQRRSDFKVFFRHYALEEWPEHVSNDMDIKQWAWRLLNHEWVLHFYDSDNWMEETDFKPLIFAAEWQLQVLLEFFVDKGANVNDVCQSYGTALGVTAQYGNDAGVRCLLDAGADVNLPDIYDRSPLCIAAQYGHLSTVLILLSAGARLNHQCGPGTPLYMAAENGHLQVVRELLAAGAEITLIGGPYGSPLLVACRDNIEDVARLLLDHGADVNIRDYQGYTALAYAVACGNPRLVHTLLDSTDLSPAGVWPTILLSIIMAYQDWLTYHLGRERFGNDTDWPIEGELNSIPDIADLLFLRNADLNIVSRLDLSRTEFPQIDYSWVDGICGRIASMILPSLGASSLQSSDVGRRILQAAKPEDVQRHPHPGLEHDGDFQEYLQDLCSAFVVCERVRELVLPILKARIEGDSAAASLTDDDEWASSSDSAL